MWWSIVLAVIGVSGLYLTTRKLAVGYAVGFGVQILWIAYAIATTQFGFIFSALAFGYVNALGWYKWTKEKVDAELDQEEEPDISPAIRYRKELVASQKSTLNDDEDDQDEETEFLYDDVLVEDRLPPSHHDNRGDPIWSVYPNIQRMGESVVLGPTHDRRYPMSKADAKLAGRALLEASMFEKDQE